MPLQQDLVQRQGVAKRLSVFLIVKSPKKFTLGTVDSEADVRLFAVRLDLDRFGPVETFGVGGNAHGLLRG